MTPAPGVRIGNRRSAPVAGIPVLGLTEFGAQIEAATAGGWRIVTLFGTPETADELRLICVMAHDARGDLAVTSALVGRDYPAISARSRQAGRFECEIAEQCAARPHGHPRLRAVRRHAPDHAPSHWHGGSADALANGLTTIGGDEVHEVAVGPVHAGIIEPGHFRFNAHGEEILSLDVVLGYQHRGVERLLECTPRDRAMYVAESIAGDSVIAHASAYCGAIEALGRSHKSPRAQAIRGIALELERLANHIGDLGALSGDVAYQPAASYFGRMRGDCLNLLMAMSGNRYGRGLVRPGGTTFDIDAGTARDIEHGMARLGDDFRATADLFFGASTVQSRLEGVGVVSAATCIAEGFVGIVARACDVPRDVRHDHPYGVFRFAQIPVSTAWAGDVYARALVRRLEVQRSIAFIGEQVHALPGGETRAPCGALARNEFVVALEEGWRGEVAHAVLTDATGSVRRHKVTDPSFHNWPAIEVAMPGNQISDFPLSNKSFNLSYAGHDL
jgi:Ni,Fe-hydrogenase III large subunit